MKQNNAESSQETPSPPPKHRRRKLIYWLAADIVVALLLLLLLFHTPAGYTPNKEVTGQDLQSYTQDYWSYLGTEIYNRAQRGQPFDLALDPNRVNEAILLGRWPQVSDGVKLYAPTAQFLIDHVQLMAAAEVQGAELILTVRLDAKIDPNGLAHLAVSAVKVGAMNITPVAKLMARKAYQNQIAYMMVDPERIETKIVSALLDNQPFDPVFYVRNIDRRTARVRVCDISFQEGQVVVRISPAP